MTSPASDWSPLRHQLKQAIAAAIANIACNGDTDIFPAPDEAVWLSSDRDSAVGRVLALHDEFDARAVAEPPEVIRCLVPAGYLGHRLASRIDPLWNAYYLSLVIACAPAIERARAPVTRVFSYRFVPPDPTGRIFDAAIGWAGFLEATREACDRHSHALVTDIGDFYHRVRIAAVADALMLAGVEPPLRERLTSVLRLLDVDRFGLPVGGPASRLLAELVLARTDDMLNRAGIPCARFVDDIRMFATSEREAQRHLLALANLLSEDGFFLQKSKTRVLRSRDLVEEMDLARAAALSPVQGSSLDSGNASPLQHDPYSELRAQVDQQLSQFASLPDAASTVMREFSKSRLNLSLARNLLAAVGHLPADQAGEVLPLLLDLADAPALTPVFGRLIESVEANLGRLSPPAVDAIRSRLDAIAFGDLAVVAFDFHRALCVRLLARLPVRDIGPITGKLAALEASTASALVRREIASARVRIGVGDASSRQRGVTVSARRGV